MEGKITQIELRKINTKDIEAQWAYTTTLPTDENGLTNPYHGVTFEEYKEKVLPTLISYEHPVNMPEWFVPETYYYLWDGDSLVGEFRIRHYLTDALRNGAGHIGYSISKEYRGKGYGTEGLRRTLEIAKEIVPEDEIFLRVNKDNIASQKVMINNGAYRAGEDEGHYFMRIAKNTVKQPQKVSAGGIEYNLVENELKAEDFIRLKVSAGFRERPKELVEKVLKNNLYDVVAVSNNEVIGMGRLVGDGVMYWYLQEIVVLPEFQGKGIGTAIVNRLLDYITEHTEEGNFTSVGLTAAEGKDGFYERFGFKRSNGMTKYIVR